jgi:hypothetical protein
MRLLQLGPSCYGYTRIVVPPCAFELSRFGRSQTINAKHYQLGHEDNEDLAHFVYICHRAHRILAQT